MGMNLLKFAVVPVSKYRGDPEILEYHEKKGTSTAATLRSPLTAAILRSPSEDEPDWTIWPIILRRPCSKNIAEKRGTNS